MDVDEASYTVLMENVKDYLHYKEIGGVDIYVIVVAKEPVKRTFLTAHQLQQQKKNGKIPRSPHMEKVLQVPVNKKGTTKRKLDLQNDIQDDIIEVKKTRDKEIVECPPVNGYELGRLRHVQENKEKFKELGLGKYAANPNLPNDKESKRKKKDGEESDEYIVENESGDDSDDSSERIKTVKEKKTVPGPRTRSRANATDLGDKDPAHAIEKKGKKVAPARNYATLLKPTCSKLLNQGDKSVQSSTFAAYIALQERQSKDLEGDRRICDVGETSLPNADEEADEEVQPAPKKRIGRTKMLKVHGRSTDEKKAIKLSKRGQPIGDMKLTCELSNFLGTLVKDHVSLTYVNWHVVLK
ncbi:hypothetical protein POM88_045117 [Heracleum sosnowskyi]|uniref:Uncharacterized protein n=1 Tax=Heracleum sosnowskyi TaxID=360622 RepID=A0AAD8H6H8_9APIA|nr:hypothetical protein POM88_045117 [Heracleum sosnowskyi]